MLIGGPNQSHKVNFKEPLPARGKISKKTFAFCFVNTFSELLEESFMKERCFLARFACHSRIRRVVLSDGIGEHGNCIFFIKIFLNNSTNDIVIS